MPTAKIATEVAMMPESPTRNATAAPMIEQAMAPTISDAIGANSDSINAARMSGGEFRVRLPDLDQLLKEACDLRSLFYGCDPSGHCSIGRKPHLIPALYRRS